MLFVLPALYLPAQAAIKIVAYFAAQSVIAFVLLEIVNYIEHCGLQRQPVGDTGSRETRRPGTVRHDAGLERRLCRVQQHAGPSAAPFRPSLACVKVVSDAGAVAGPSIDDGLRRLHFAGHAAAGVVCGDAQAP